LYKAHEFIRESTQKVFAKILTNTNPETQAFKALETIVAQLIQLKEGKTKQFVSSNADNLSLYLILRQIYQMKFAPSGNHVNALQFEIFGDKMSANITAVRHVIGKST
jgi:hypothetical protein